MRRVLPVVIVAAAALACGRPAHAQSWGALIDPTLPIMNGRNGPSFEYSTGIRNWDSPRPKSGPNAYPVGSNGGWTVRPRLPFSGNSRVRLLHRPHPARSESRHRWFR